MTQIKRQAMEIRRVHLRLKLDLLASCWVSARLGASHREKRASCHSIDLRQVQDLLFGAGVYIPALAFC